LIPFAYGVFVSGKELCENKLVNFLGEYAVAFGSVVLAIRELPTVLLNSVVEAFGDRNRPEA